ncbi:MAG: sugar ABC transporter permease [Anaerolineae bacterium]|nr:sugar ABC transporter permease [Anaerolineae bacterium]
MQAATADQNSSTKPPSRPLTDNARFLGAAMLLPAVLYIILLVGVPFILAIAFSFTSVTTGNPDLKFVGLDTFKAILSDSQFLKALINTVIFTVISQILIVLCANILALALSQKFPGKRIIRFLILLPWATPVALGALGWWWMVQPQYSPLTTIGKGLGLFLPNAYIVYLAPNRLFGVQVPGPSGSYFLGLNLTGLFVILVHVWRMLPMSTVIIMAGLTSIDHEIRDAAKVDGANFFQEYWHITLPLLRSITAVAMLFSIVFTFTDMAVVRVLTLGNNDTHVLASWAYFKGIEGGNLAEGAAIAVFLLPLLIAVAVFMLRLARRVEVH